MIRDLAYLEAGIQDYEGKRAPNFAGLNGTRFGTPGNEESEMTQSAYSTYLYDDLWEQSRCEYLTVILPWYVMICTCKGYFPFDRSISTIIWKMPLSFERNHLQLM